MSPHYKCIDEWLKTGETLRDCIQNSDEKQIPLLKFIVRVFEFNEKLDSAKDLEKDAQHLLESFDEKKDDIRAYFLFLNNWCSFVTKSRRYKEAEAIYNRMEAIDPKKIPIELVSNKLRMRGLLTSIVKGNKEQRKALIKEAIEVLPTNSNLYYLSLFEYAVFLAQDLLYKDASDLVDEAIKNKNAPKYFGNNILAAIIIHYSSTFQLDKADEYYKKYDQKSASSITVSSVEIIKSVAKHYKTNFILPSETVPSLATEIEDYYEHINYSNHYLASGEPGTALKWIRKLINKYDNPTKGVGFFSYALIRAELANKNEQAARIQLVEKVNRGGANYMDDFFWARIELLAGNREKAAEYFSIVLQACKYYEAENVLNAELILSSELSRADIAFLFMHVKKINGKSPKEITTRFSDEPPKLSSLGIDRIIGNSQATDLLKEEVRKYAKLNTTILITGETGVGKDVVARALHEESDRNKEPFLAINCGAINDSLLQSELFGYEAGAYTGAEKAHKGIFEAAGKGTVFLDEIGDISPGLQVALLRVLEAGEVRPVGSTKPRLFQARILAATNAPLENMVDEGKFRQDLLYRLKKLVIYIPPLRERPKDILDLTQYFFQQQNPQEQPPTLTIKLLNAFKDYQWPGNIRELRNEVEKMRLLNSEKTEYDIEDSNIFKNNQKKESGRISVNEKDKLLAQIRGNNSSTKRLNEIKDFFRKHKSLTRNEIAKVMNTSLPTTTRDLKILQKEGFIKKIEPSSSPRSHYFILNQDS